jgi:hypothetical protein
MLYHFVMRQNSSACGIQLRKQSSMNLKHSEAASLLPTTSIVFTFHDSATSFRVEERSGEVDKERRHVTSEIRMHECIQAFTAVAVPFCQNPNAFQ